MEDGWHGGKVVRQRPISAQDLCTEEDLRRALAHREEQLQHLTAASLAAQEEERQWIACEVHDRIAQTLASVFQLLQRLESVTPLQSEEHLMAVRASILLRQAIRESRNIMNDLHPPVLDDLGVVPLVEEELRHFEEDTRCPTKLTADYKVRPSRDVEIALYRIFHEALINIGRHARGARNVAVSLASSDSVVSLLVRDDGPGFDVEAELQGRRVGGLMSMRRRAEIIGGSFEVSSSPGGGTSVAVHVPMDGSNREGGIEE